MTSSETDDDSSRSATGSSRRWLFSGDADLEWRDDGSEFRDAVGWFGCISTHRATALPEPGGRARSGAPGRLTGVPTLNLARNSFTTLPAGVFSGLTALVDLTLGGNPTDPLQLTVTVEKVGTGQVRAKVLEGAP